MIEDEKLLSIHFRFDVVQSMESRCMSTDKRLVDEYFENMILALDEIKR